MGSLLKFVQVSLDVILSFRCVKPNTQPCTKPLAYREETPGGVRWARKHFIFYREHELPPIHSYLYNCCFLLAEGSIQCPFNLELVLVAAAVQEGQSLIPVAYLPF